MVYMYHSFLIHLSADGHLGAHGHFKDTKLSIETKALLLSGQKMLWQIVGCRFAGPGLQSRGAHSLWVHMGRRQVPDWLVVPFLGSGLSEGAVGSGSQDRAGTIYRLCPEPGLRKNTQGR